MELEHLEHLRQRSVHLKIYESFHVFNNFTLNLWTKKDLTQPHKKEAGHLSILCSFSLSLLPLPLSE